MTYLDEMSNISNMHSDLERSISIVNDMQSVVEILGRFRINGEHSVLSEIASNVGRLLV